jgi:hypothetical protein
MIRLPDIPFGRSVPKHLYQICLPNADNLPDALAENVRNLQALNPGWEYWLLDEAKAEAFILETYGKEMMSLYDRIDPAYRAVQSDILRYLLCYARGGVYLDLKSTVTRPLDQVLRPDDVFLLSQWLVDRHKPAGVGQHPELRHIPGHEYCNWAIFSAPGHPFLRAAIERFTHNMQTYAPFRDGVGRYATIRMAGPITYSLAIHPLREKYPHRYVDFEGEEGVQFSIYGDISTHRGTTGRHYSELTIPVVKGSSLRSALTVLCFKYLTPAYLRVHRAIAKRLPWRRQKT